MVFDVDLEQELLEEQEIFHDDDQSSPQEVASLWNRKILCIVKMFCR